MLKPKIKKNLLNINAFTNLMHIKWSKKKKYNKKYVGKWIQEMKNQSSKLK